MDIQYVKILGLAEQLENNEFTVQDIQKNLYVNSITARLSEMRRIGLIQIKRRVPRTKEHPGFTVYVPTAVGKTYFKEKKKSE